MNNTGNGTLLALTLISATDFSSIFPLISTFDSFTRNGNNPSYRGCIEIARYDLASRGPGDIGGVRQSGVPDLNVSDIYSDIRILEVARIDAQNILNNPEDINNKEIIAYISSNISDNLVK